MKRLFLLTIFATTLLLACNSATQTKEELPINQDTLSRTYVINEVNQPPICSVDKLKLIDKSTSEELTYIPKLNKKYIIHVSVDSIGNRPVILTSKKQIEIKMISDLDYEVTFKELGKVAIDVGIDCRKKTAYNLVKVYDKDTLLSQQYFYVHRDIYYMLAYNYTVEE
jgi:hypothetical protein